MDYVMIGGKKYALLETQSKKASLSQAGQKSKKVSPEKTAASRKTKPRKGSV